MPPSADGFILRPRSNPRRFGKMKRTLCLGAGGVALLGWFFSSSQTLPAFMGYTLYAVALVDVAAAFILPQIIEKHSLSWRFLFFSDRFELAYGEKSTVFVLPYSNIETVEEINAPVDTEAGLISIRLRTYEAIRPPRGLPSGPNRIALLSLPREDRPFERIKELVEKSRVA